MTKNSDELAAFNAPKPAIDSTLLGQQRDWSRATFGDGPRTVGLIKHIEKELDEIRDDPLDVVEWVDVMILAVDGAWRAGFEPQQIIDAYRAKLEKNYARQWPKPTSQDEPVFHQTRGEKP